MKGNAIVSKKYQYLSLKVYKWRVDYLVRIRVQKENGRGTRSNTDHGSSCAWLTTCTKSNGRHHELESD